MSCELATIQFFQKNYKLAKLSIVWHQRSFCQSFSSKFSSSPGARILQKQHLVISTPPTFKALTATPVKAQYPIPSQVRAADVKLKLFSKTGILFGIRGMQTQELVIFVYTCSPMQTVSILPRFTYWSHYMDILNLAPQQKIASVSSFLFLRTEWEAKTSLD